MKKYISFFLLLLLLPMWRVKGACTNAQIVRLNQLAKNITTSYQYYTVNGGVEFRITLTNLTKDLLVYDKVQREEYTNKNGELTISGYKPGTMVRYLVLAKDEKCTDQNLMNIYVNLPSYNPYYGDLLCKQLADYKFCQKWIAMPFSYEEFKKNVQAEIDSRNKKEATKNAKITESYSIFEILFKFYLEYYYILLPLIIII